MKFWSLQLVKERELNKQIQLEAMLESQLYDTEGNQLPFHKTPPTPKYDRSGEDVPLSAGVYNLIRGILNECRP